MENEKDVTSTSALNKPRFPPKIPPRKQPPHKQPKPPGTDEKPSQKMNFTILPLCLEKEGSLKPGDVIEVVSGRTYEENEITPAIPPAHELGLMEDDAAMHPTGEPKVFLFQLPVVLPFSKGLTEAEKPPENEQPTEDEHHIKDEELDKPDTKGCSLKDLPAGYVGKMLVYKSGKIRMKIGDALLDVSAGLKTLFSEEVVVIDAKAKRYCTVGKQPKHAVVTPDIDCLIEAMERI